MIPRGAEGVGHLATRIATETAPKMTDAYTAADLGMIAGLLGMVAQDFDRSIETIMADMADINAILTKARPHFAGGPLNGRMAGVLASRSDGWRQSQLAAWLDAAMDVLIDLHAAVEDIVATAPRTEWAAELDRALWTFLDAYVARRRYDSAF